MMRPSKPTYHRPDVVVERDSCRRSRFIAQVARWMFPTAPTVRVRITLYDAPPEYVDAWIEQGDEA
jgi:hypothetical protein